MLDLIRTLLNADGDTCLHYAARNYQCKEVLQAIISHGVDVNVTNKKNITALMTALEEGNEDAINVLLTAGSHQNIADADGDTCLHYAARKYNWKLVAEVLHALISHGVDVNTTNKNNVTVLMIACFRGNTAAIPVLLNAGADANIVDADGFACLHYAAQNYLCTEVLQALISHGVDVNTTSKNSVTVLMTACNNGNTDAIHVLLNAGADANIVDADGDTCLHYAAGNYQCTEVLQAIISHGVDVNATTKENVTALIIACDTKNTDAIPVLLNAGADPNIADANGYTCLHYAAQSIQCTEILQAIISHGINVNATNKVNVTALEIACQKGNNKTINVLLNVGADPNIANADGYTCLHWAALNHQYLEILQGMISHGADVNATSKKKVTALMVACHMGNTDAIHVLLNAGADANIVDADGYTSLHDAARNSQCTEILQAIISHDGDVNATSKNNATALMAACRMEHTAAIPILLNAGADPNIADADGDTSLHYAARNYLCTEALQTIISHGGDVNATSKNNATALMIACRMRNTPAIHVLLDAGADPNIADADGDTSLHYAARNYLCAEALQTIISHSGDVNATNKNNVTALMIACEKSNKDAINILLNAGADPNIADADGDIWLHCICCIKL